MAARISLLILVTGLFAAAWSGDHPPISMTEGPSEPVKQSPYRDDAVRETVLYRWKQNSDDEQVADAWEAVRDAETRDAVTVRIDWLGLAGQLQKNWAKSDRLSRGQPLWHRLTSPVARMIASQQKPPVHAIAAEPGDAARQ